MGDQTHQVSPPGLQGKPQPGKTRRFFFRFLAISLVFIFGFSAILGFYAFKAFSNPFRRVIVIGDSLTEKDDQIGFVPARNSSCRRILPWSEIDYSVHTDHRGARVNRPGEKTPDRVDLVTIGGSFAWGHGIENTETFTQRLAELGGFQVANLALGAYGTLQALQMLERNKDLSPRYVVYAIINDHLKRNLSPCAPSYAPFCRPVAHVAFDDHEKPYIHSPIAEYAREDLYEKFTEEIAYAKEIGWHDVLWKIRADVYRFKDRKRTRFENTSRRRAIAAHFLINEIVAVTQAMDSTLIIVFIPYLTPGKVNRPAGRIQQTVRETPAELINLEPVVKSYYEDKSKPLLRFELDGHPNAKGHVLIAEHVYRRIQELEKAAQRTPVTVASSPW